MRGVALVLLILLLAGCAARAAPPGNQVLAEDEPALPGTVPLRILVINDEYLPVAGATVHIVGLGLQTQTDDAGDAFFQIQEPGRYKLHVHSRGYYPNVTAVDVEGLAQVKRVWLRDAPRDGHFSDFYYYQAVCDATVYAPPAATQSECPAKPYWPKPTARWILARGLQRGVIDLDWDRLPGGADAMRLEILFPEVGAFPDGRPSLVKEGSAPVRVTIPPELITPDHQRNGVVLEVRAGLPRSGPGLIAHQPFRFEAQLDYFQPAPDVQDH